MSARSVLLTLVLAAGLGPASMAETLVSSGTEMAQATINRPVRGMSMETVEARYGLPISTREPVGDPPITRWEYEGFIVYFEYKFVIHTVRKRRQNS